MGGRILLAGTHSSVGKTTVALGLLGAFRQLGKRVAPFKAGPDYIDPSLHAQAAGRPSRNLDTWLMDEGALLQVVRRGMRDTDLALIEGMMGLFDGLGSTQQGSTAEVARTLQTPVVLIVDVNAMSVTAAALVLGCLQMRPAVNLVGVILNRVGSQGHLQGTSEAIRAVTGLPVLGSLPDDRSIALRERHLGLVPAAEGGAPLATTDRLAELVRERFDLAHIEGLASAAPPLPPGPPGLRVEPVPGGARIGVAQDAAFGFYYQDTIDLLAECGAEIIPFSPLADTRLPADVQGLYVGGGFPELYAAELSSNTSLRGVLQAHAAQGHPIYAECGGLMALGATLTTLDGDRLPMFGLLPVVSQMQREQLTIAYREVEAVRPNPLMTTGARVRGHEFHWSTASPPPAAVAAYRVVGDDAREGFCVGNTLASYVHLNLAGNPSLARRFVATCAQAVRS